MECGHCHAPLLGRQWRFCPGGACRQAAYRRRRAGLPEDHRVSAGRRGRVPLAGKTKSELLDELAATIRGAVSGMGAAVAVRELLERNRHLAEAARALDRLDAEFPPGAMRE